MPSDDALLRQLNAQFSHIWMVRAFLKHCDEAADDEELCEVHRDLYDVMHSLGPALEASDWTAYLKQVRKKINKLNKAAQFFAAIQPEVSQHMNFKLAAQSLTAAVAEVKRLLRADA